MLLTNYIMYNNKLNIFLVFNYKTLFILNIFTKVEALLCNFAFCNISLEQKKHKHFLRHIFQ